MGDRSLLRVVRIVAATLASTFAVLALAWPRGFSGTAQAASPTTPITIDGLPLTKVWINLSVSGTRIEPALHEDVTKADGLRGLSKCAPYPMDLSSMPTPPGFTCAPSGGFDTSSLTKLEHVLDVTEVGGSTARHHYESLYFLGVLRGEPALVVRPLGGRERLLKDLSTLRAMPGVVHCASMGAVGTTMPTTIACAMRTHGAAVHDRRAAERLRVAYADVIESW